ncbi:MAG: hypothetical protein JOZ72_01545 [Alphaproteobacteria bacterium]|nr:hypothetical protein [Alphaproteobacteria bacterium]
MRFSTLALAGAFALAATATGAWADDPMANTYGNTVTTKSQKTGMSGQLMFNADGSYSANGMGPDGKPMTYQGKWTLKDGGATICLSPTLPNPPPMSCTPLMKHNVGESWSVTNDQGETFDVSITAGR